eukprot:TRINITY_DN58847_c0_g2_i1.p1 TRINITY_DN58847_c0_g2~~TRINITY_DN58847_c0_g2_i1.p1  ORF type:complete len:873 (+),score=131.57 TRINITY_DN58847_c0_g2_i1:125-2743(+)
MAASLRSEERASTRLAPSVQAQAVISSAGLGSSPRTRPTLHRGASAPLNEGRSASRKGRMSSRRPVSNFERRDVMPSFIATIAVCGPLSLGVVLLTSNLTSLGYWWRTWLSRRHNINEVQAGHGPLGKIHQLDDSLVIGFAMMLSCYLLDLQDLEGCRRRLILFPYCCVTLAFLIYGVLVQYPERPVILLGIGLVLTVVSSVLSRCMLTGVSKKFVAAGESAAYAVLAFVWLLAWTVWQLSTTAGRIATGKAFDVGGVDFQLWCSPGVFGGWCGVVSVFAWMRSRLHFSSGLHSDGSISVAPEFILALCLLVAAAVVAWVGASFSAEEHRLSEVVLAVFAASFGGLGVYIIHWIGIHRLSDVLKENSLMQWLGELLLSDWSKAGFMLTVGPFLPVYFFVEMVHQAVRRTLYFLRCLLCCCPEVDEETDYRAHRGWITREANCYWTNLMGWEAISVFSKSMYCGILVFICQVGFAKGLIVFLAWFNEVSSEWSMWTSVSLLFAVEMMLFLFPPVAGIPLYLMASLVLIPRLEKDQWSAFGSVGIASGFCLFLKLAATGVEQKCIGGPMKNNVTVKMFIGVHTPLMKAFRYILCQDGIRLRKAFVLVGGPDWPTSVITGILGLPLCDMLIGTLPVYFLVLPVCIAGYYMVHPKAPNAAMMQQVWLGVSAAAQGVAFVLASLSAHKVMEEFQAELNDEESEWQRDPQEHLILEQVRRDKLRAERERAAMAGDWRSLSCGLKLVLLIGSFTSSGILCILANPVQPPIKDFKLTDSIKELDQHGGVLSLISKSGWWAIYLTGMVLLCIFIVWVRNNCMKNAPSTAQGATSFYPPASMLDSSIDSTIELKTCRSQSTSSHSQSYTSSIYGGSMKPRAR